MRDLQEDTQHGSWLSYGIGFIACLFLTFVAYFIVTEKLLPSSLIIYTITGVGLIQVAVQMLLFLHLGHESKPRWNLLLFFFMVSFVLIVVWGSIWIMNHLNYNTMPGM